MAIRIKTFYEFDLTIFYQRYHLLYKSMLQKCHKLHITNQPPEYSRPVSATHYTNIYTQRMSHKCHAVQEILRIMQLYVTLPGAIYHPRLIIRSSDIRADLISPSSRMILNSFFSSECNTSDNRVFFISLHRKSFLSG